MDNHQIMNGKAKRPSAPMEMYLLGALRVSAIPDRRQIIIGAAYQ
ncbi:MAG TPA: hypothetical protein PLR75_01470 [Candidatus Pacearchaeota archaeon]|nr:hypothetical protein [Candidatus Pacearchaeota archaeon]